MAADNNVQALNGLFKEVYADKLQDLVPDGVMLHNLVPFVPKEKATGNLYHQPVVLGQEHGFSYGGTTGEAFALAAPVASQVKDATVQGYEFLLRSRLSYGAVARSMNSKAAFESATKLIVANMLKSFAKRIEAMLFYGQVGLAVADNTAGAAGGVITIKTAEWAPALWSGSVGMLVEVYNTTALIPASLALSASITSVSLEAKTITLNLTVGEQAAITAAMIANDVLNIFHSGARGNEFAGLHKIMTNTSSIFGIDASVYDMWKSVSQAASGPLSFDIIQKAIAKGVEKGLDSDVICLINPRAWSNLMNDQAALRMFDQSYNKGKTEVGSQGIEFHSQNGKVEIKPCNFVKEGVAYILSIEELMRVGSTDVTFKLPGSNDKFFRELDNSAGYELRAYSDQALFCSSPARMILITGIVNS